MLMIKNRNLLAQSPGRLNGQALLNYLILLATVFVFSVPAFKLLKHKTSQRLVYEFSQPAYLDVASPGKKGSE